ncbi:MAG: hypothetical protein H0X01_07820 [Nitrospira sp.]|nr:hypothetical protein [Nitrospira sp.]
MADDIQNTIEVLTARVKVKEEEANKLKKLVNELCAEAGIPPRFQNIADAGVASIRSDQFYGLPLTTAIRNYLEMRRASNLGAATVTDIYRAIKEGGYRFGTKNEEIARVVVGNALRKTSAIFHRLPNGQFGLLTWYPSARAPAVDHSADAGKAGHKRGQKPKRTGSKKSGEPEALRPRLLTPVALSQSEGENNTVTNEEIRQVVLSQEGNFTGQDIDRAVKEIYPTKKLSDSKISTVLFRLKASQLIRVVSPRSGKTGATFAKCQERR